MCVLKRKSKILGFLSQNYLSEGNFMQRIDCAHSRSLRMLPWPWFSIFTSIHIFPESGSRKHFQDSGMRAIDSPHETTPRNMILREKFQIFSIFASIHTSISLNQGQGSIFKLWECAQSIFRMILPLYRLFW